MQVKSTESWNRISEIIVREAVHLGEKRLTGAGTGTGRARKEQYHAEVHKFISVRTCH